MTACPLISIERVTLQHGGNPIVREASLQISEGEVVALIGASGSGKSLLSRTPLNLLPPGIKREKGEILYRNRSLLTLSDQEIRTIRGREIAMILQSPFASLDPTMKIGHQIGEGYHHHHPSLTRKEVKKEVFSWLERVGILPPKESYNLYPHEMSGGMQQRIAIAMALINRPSLLIADEITTALDASTQQDILYLLQSIQAEEGMAVLFITHNLSLVRQWADRIAVMYQGEIIETASPDALFTSPQNAYSQHLIDALPPPIEAAL
ncbi:MAG: ABC transporter ATP-binding protein [Chlamydiota bacterium]|nr:ABC transporter ATP-binding protein [Chlamydiota bacterium]